MTQNEIKIDAVYYSFDLNENIIVLNKQDKVVLFTTFSGGLYETCRLELAWDYRAENLNQLLALKGVSL